MGVVVHVHGDFSNVDLQYVKSFLESTVESATNSPISRVIEHGVVKQSREEVRRELLKMQSGR